VRKAEIMFCRRHEGPRSAFKAALAEGKSRKYHTIIDARRVGDVKCTERLYSTYMTYN
jgi:hypothetical protein